MPQSLASQCVLAATNVIDQARVVKAAHTIAQAIAIARGAARDRKINITVARSDPITRLAPIEERGGEGPRPLRVCALPYGLRGGWGSRVCAAATDQSLIAAEGKEERSYCTVILVG